MSNLRLVLCADPNDCLPILLRLCGTYPVLVLSVACFTVRRSLAPSRKRLRNGRGKKKGKKWGGAKATVVPDEMELLSHPPALGPRVSRALIGESEGRSSTGLMVPVASDVCTRRRSRK